MAQQRAPVVADSIWERHKENIALLYAKHTLAHVMSEMKNVHGFSATEKQFKRKLTCWGLDKKVKSHEFESLLRDPNGARKVRGIEVSESKVRRWKTRRLRLEKEDDGRLSTPTRSQHETRQSSTHPLTPQSIAVDRSGHPLSSREVSPPIVLFPSTDLWLDDAYTKIWQLPEDEPPASIPPRPKLPRRIPAMDDQIWSQIFILQVVSTEATRARVHQLTES